MKKKIVILFLAAGVALSITLYPIPAACAFLGLLCLFLALKYPLIPLLLLIFGMSSFGKAFAYLRISFLGIPVYISEIVMFVLAGAIIANIFMGKIKIRRSPLDMAFLCYFFIGAVCFLRGLQAYGIEALRDAVLAYYAVFYFFVILLITDERSFKAVLMCFFAGSVCALLFIGFNFFKGQYTATSTGSFRYAHGSYSLYLALPVIFFFALVDSGIHVSLPIMVVGTFQFIGVLLVQHRSAWLAMIMSFIFIVFLGKNRVTQKRMLFFVSLGIIFLVVIFMQTIASTVGDRPLLTRMKTIIDYTGDPNAMWRLLAWREVMVKKFAENPIWGVGFGAPLLWYYGAGERDPHNSHLALMARMGVVGFIVYAIINILFFYQCMKFMTRATDSLKRAYMVGIIGAYLFILIFSCFNVVLEGPYMGIFYWITMGMGMALMNISEEGYAKINGGTSALRI